MGLVSENFPLLVVLVVLLCWISFGVVFLVRKSPEQTQDKLSDRTSIVGFVLQLLGLGVVWLFRRQYFSQIVWANPWLMLVVGLLTIFIAVSSVYLIIKAVRTLGKEWSLTARMLEGHHLATIGPYAYVRHPIYLGLLGMLLATGLALSNWPSILIALLLYLAGTLIRINREEKLLRQMFGEEFENYSKQVKAIIPGLY